MCEVKRRDGSDCPITGPFHVCVRTVPQPLGPNGEYGMEGRNAGRSIVACAAHLAIAVRRLTAVPNRTGALPTVALFNRGNGGAE